MALQSAVSGEPSVTALEAFVSRGDAAEVSNAPEIVKNQRMAKELEPLRLQTADNRQSILEAGKGANETFTPQELENMRLITGMGMRNEDETIKKGPGEKEAQELIEATRDAFAQLSNYVQYFDVQRYAEKNGVTPKDAANKLGVKNWDALRNRVMTSLFNLDLISEAIPQLKDIPENQRVDVIEGYLGSHKDFRVSLVGKLRELYITAKTFPQEQSDQRRLLERTRDNQLEHENDLVKRLSTTLNVPEDQIRQMMTGGRNSQDISFELVNKLMDSKGFQNPTAIREYISIDQEYQDIVSKINLINSQIITARPGFKLTADEEYQNSQIRESRKPLELQRTQLDSRRSISVQTLGGNIINVQKMVGEYEAVYDNVFGKTDAQGRVINPGVQITINDLLKTRAEFIDTKAKIDSQPQTLGPQGLARLKLEWDMVNSINNVVAESVRDVLLARHREVESLRSREQENKANEAAKAKKDAVAVGIRVVNKEGKTRYVEEGAGKKGQDIINATNIGEDLRYVASRGPEGIKRLILRTLQEKGLIKEFKDQYEGIIIIQPRSGPPRPVTWNEVDFNQLSQDQRSLIDDVYSASGDAFQSRLFEGYDIARREGGRWALRQINLSEKQWIRLNSNFKGMLAGNLRKSAELRKELADLKEKGAIKSASFLFMLLAGIGLFSKLKPSNVV